MPGLGVNVDHIATIREARKTIEPDPVLAAVDAETAGADCITFHLRKDRRHISDRDARLLKERISIKLNMEMSMDREIVDIAMELKPQQVTLVPENRQEITTEGGLDCVAHFARLLELCRLFQAEGIIVSAFVDPEKSQIEAAARAGCPAIEIHTGTYANCSIPPDGSEPDAAAVETELGKVAAGVEFGIDLDLIVHAGHGLTYTNVTPVAKIDGLTELNIGHSIISRAAFVGISQAVIEMKKLLTF